MEPQKPIQEKPIQEKPIQEKPIQEKPIQVRYHLISKSVYQRGINLLLRPVDCQDCPENGAVFIQGTRQAHGSIELPMLNDETADRFDFDADYLVTFQPVRPTGRK